MIVAPITGCIGTGVNTEHFFLFDIPKFADTGLYTMIAGGMDFKEFEEPIDLIHRQVLGEWLIWLLILGHASAAMYPHFVKKDPALKRTTSSAS